MLATFKCTSTNFGSHAFAVHMSDLVPLGKAEYRVEFGVASHLFERFFCS